MARKSTRYKYQERVIARQSDEVKNDSGEWCTAEELHARLKYPLMDALKLQRGSTDQVIVTIRLVRGDEPHVDDMPAIKDMPVINDL